jgi:hypothetical protein
MKRLMLFAPAVVVAVACSGQTSTIQPGNWEMVTKITSVEIPGMTGPAAEQMQRAMTSQSNTQTVCITPQQAANPMGGMMGGGQNSQGCQFSDQTFSGGVMRATATCPGPNNQGQVRMSWEGSYTPTTMQANVRTEMSGGPQNMRIAATMNSRRTGDCPSGS